MKSSLQSLIKGEAQKQATAPELELITSGLMLSKWKKLITKQFEI